MNYYLPKCARFQGSAWPLRKNDPYESRSINHLHGTYLPKCTRLQGSTWPLHNNDPHVSRSINPSHGTYIPICTSLQGSAWPVRQNDPHELRSVSPLNLTHVEISVKKEYCLKEYARCRESNQNYLDHHTSQSTLALTSESL